MPFQLSVKRFRDLVPQLHEELTEELSRLQGEVERERTHSQELAKELRKTQVREMLKVEPQLQEIG